MERKIQRVMGARLAYHLFIIPASYLPLPVLYVFTDVLFLLLISVYPYRSKVITSNLTRSFPEKNHAEIKTLRRKFYRHFTDLIAEGIKNLTISERQLRKRFKVENPEVMHSLFEKQRNVLLISGHFNNWEWLVTGQPLIFPHIAYGIGMPMTSKFWDKKINERRERFGMHVIHSKNYKEVLNGAQESCKAVLVLADQSPGNSLKSYWTRFLNQDTAVLFGTEMMAHELDYSCVFFETQKIKRGYYSMKLTLICENPRTCAWGEITERHTQLLEQAIRRAPTHWLWSHKRWKREVPANLEALKQQQHEQFKQRFMR